MPDVPFFADPGRRRRKLEESGYQILQYWALGADGFQPGPQGLGATNYELCGINKVCFSHR